MKEINDKDAARLVSMIYRPNLNENWDDARNGKSKCTVKLLVGKIETELEDESSSDKFGGEMTKEEYQDVINQIKSSDMLMNMEIVNFEDNDSTNFRAMTLKDPTNQYKPIIVFRGTSGSYQWDDNFAGMLSSRTPSQQEAQEYVVKSGYDHLTVAGHSKGGNLAASMAYLLPEGMVDKVYSFDGQGASNMFLSNIPGEHQEYAKSSVFNINEYRDIVSQLLNKTGSDENTICFDSGVEFKDTGFGFFNIKMRIFHPHKPNYFLIKDIKYPVEPATLPGWAHKVSELDLSRFKKSRAIYIAKSIANMIGGDDDSAWSEELWSTVYDAEAMYQRVNSEREQAIVSKLSQIYGFDFSNYILLQNEGSFVVEGAVLTCQFCSGIGTLEHIENHGHVIQNKAVASIKDNKADENIKMENVQCSVINYAVKSPKAEEHDCKPNIIHEWVITDSNKQVTVAGEKVNAVLKKSALGCLNGGMIVVVANGQMMGDVKKLPPKMSKSVGKKNFPKEALRYSLKAFENVSTVNAVDSFKFKEKCRTLINESEQNSEDLRKEINHVKDRYIDKIINSKLNSNTD